MGFDLGSMMSMFKPTIKSQDVIINKLKAAKTIEAGDMSGIMDKVMQGGLSKFLQNPSGGSGGKAKQNAQTGANQAAAAFGGGGYNNPVTQAFSGLSSDLDSLMNQAAFLVGIGSDNQGLLKTLGLVDIADTFDPASPYHSSVVLAPADSEDLLQDIAAQCLQIANDFIIGSIGIDDAVTRINSMRSEVQAVTNGSTAAITALTNAVTALQSAMAANALSQGGLPKWQEIMKRAINQESRAEIDIGNEKLLNVEDDTLVLNV